MKQSKQQFSLFTPMEPTPLQQGHAAAAKAPLGRSVAASSLENRRAALAAPLSGRPARRVIEGETPVAQAPVQASPVQTAPKQASAPVHHAPMQIKQHDRVSSLDEIYKKLVDGVREYCKKHHFKRVTLGLSGGVDSALTLKIAVDAMGGENVTALLMPELGLTRQENIDHAKLLCQFFQVNCFYQSINSFVADFSAAPWRPNTLAYMNTKARIRAVLLYSFANTENALVLGTSNRSEILLGYGTKYGDLAADLEVIGDLYKTEVVKLADHIGLPPEIVNKTPSAELAPGQTDEEEIGAAYSDLDKVLTKLHLGQDGCIARGLPTTLVQLVFRRYRDNKHKAELPPIIKVR